MLSDMKHLISISCSWDPEHSLEKTREIAKYCGSLSTSRQKSAMVGELYVC